MARTKGATDKTPRKNAKEHKNGASESSAQSGHNSGLNDDQRRALFVNHVVAIEEARENLDDAYTAADAAGITKKDINYALKLRKGDEGQLVQRRKRENEIARWLNHPVGTQADLFETVTVGNVHHENGRIAAMEGKVCKPPDTLNQHDAGQFVAGWHLGNAARNETLARALEKSAEASKPTAGSDLADSALEDAQTH